MQFPWSRKPNPEALSEKAMSLLQSGDTVRAEETALKGVRAAEDGAGGESGGYYKAKLALATVFLVTRRMDRAAEILEEATRGGTPADSSAQRERLTALMNLGEILIRLERYDEAERALRQGLEGRRAFYGADHPGYAFGLEPLGELLLAREKYGEALPVLEEVEANFHRNQHPRWLEGLALQVIGRLATGDAERAFKGAHHLPRPRAEEFVIALANKTVTLTPALARVVLLEGYEFAARVLGEADQTALNLLAHLSNQEQEWGAAGDVQNRLAVIRRAKHAYQKAGRTDDVVQALMGLSVAQSAAGDTDAAEASYREAMDLAEQVGDRALLSRVQRNFGLYYSEMERREEAEPLLRASVETASHTGDRQMEARAGVALGIFLQHGGHLEEARPVLERALRVLPTNDPDAICGRSHLRAIVSGGSCGCGDTGDAMAQAFREFVLKRVPEGLLEDLQVTFAEDGPKMEVKLKREPQPDEVEHLNRTLQHALADFQKELENSRRR